MSNFDPENHEHDEDNNCLDDEGNIVYSAQQNGTERPSYPLSSHDLIGITISTLGGLFASAAIVVQQGSQLIAQEFFASANHRREQDFERANRRLIIEDIRSLERGEVE